MRLDGKRIELIPLTARQLTLWLENVKALEAELDCIYRGEPVMGPFIDFVCRQASKAENDPDNYLFHTIWFIMRKTDRIVIGEMAFTGTPNENHEVEIGYGLNPEFQGMGYMTEAVGVLCKWVLAQEGVDHVIASTENNIKSENTLKRAGFVKYKQDGTTSWWRI